MLITPGRAPPTFTQTRRTARPIVALARKPAPNTDAAQFTSSARRIGPLTMTRGVTASVVPDTPTRENSGSQIALTAAMTTGMYSGRQPGITALTATRSTVARPLAGATRPISSSPPRPLAATVAPTRSAVGGTTGRPSVTPRANSSSIGSDAAGVTARIVTSQARRGALDDGPRLSDAVAACTRMPDSRTTARRRWLVLVGADKLVPVLGSRGRLPVEVVPFAPGPCRRRLEALGYPATLRTADGAPVVTDNGNRLLDCRVGPIADPAALEAALRATPGVVGTGLFIGMMPAVLMWDGSRCRTLTRENRN